MAKPKERPEYNTKEERLAALKRSARAINKSAGIDGITMASDLETWETAGGVPEIDEQIGGGIPHGNFSCIWGDAGSGKTTYAMKVAAQAQKEGKLVAWAALEPFDPLRAKQMGIKLDEMPVLQFPKAEQVLDVLIEYARSKLVDVFILDSVHSLAPKGMQENSKGEKSLETDTMALLARKLSEFFKIATDPVKRSKMAVLFIGQTRKDLGGFVTLDKLTGGNALIHSCKLIMHIRRGAKNDAPTEKYTDDAGRRKDRCIGFNCVIKLDKVQVPNSKPEMTMFAMPFYYETGFDLPDSIKQQIEAEEAEIKAQNEAEAHNTDDVENVAKTEDSKLEIPKKRRGRPKKVRNE